MYYVISSNIEYLPHQARITQTTNMHSNPNTFYFSHANFPLLRSKGTRNSHCKKNIQEEREVG